MYLTIIPSIVIPEGHNWRVIQCPDPIDIKGSLYFLYDDFWIFISMLVLLVLFWIVIEFGSMKFIPLGKVDAVVVGSVAGALDCEDFVGVVFELEVFGERGVEGGRFGDEIDGHAWPFDVQSMQHIVCGVVEFQYFSLFEGFVAIQEDLRLLDLGRLGDLGFGL